MNPYIKALLVKSAAVAEEKQLKDFEYLIHHVVTEDGKEEVHHCRLYDHLGNLFTQGHLVIEDGVAKLDGHKVTSGTFHVLTGLEPTQEICWSDGEALEKGITPKKMVDGMTSKKKAKVW